jgi:hypothetical protein
MISVRFRLNLGEEFFFFFELLEEGGGSVVGVVSCTANNKKAKTDRKDRKTKTSQMFLEKSQPCLTLIF